MRYLIIIDNEVFYTEWFDVENNFMEGVMVIDLHTDKYMRTRGLWIEIPKTK